MTSDLFRTTLRQRLLAVSDRVLLTVLTSGKEDHRLEFTGTDLVEQSIQLAEQYCKVPPSSVVLLLLPHCPELFLLHLGLCLTGRLPAILAWPTNRIDPEKYQRNILHQLQNLPAAQLLTLPRLARNIDPGTPFTVTECPVENHERFENLFSMELAVTRVEKQPTQDIGNDVPRDALFLQFSGGTTGDQKCVVVTAPMLVNQLDRLSRTLEFTQRDGVASWLPMYHDMGLIACFWLPLWNGAPSTQFAASDWLMDPGLLFRLMSRFQATFCWLPNFAFSYLAAQKGRIDRTLNLSHVRAWINCSEPVRERAFDTFTTAFSGLGVRPEQCQASYAMAENVFAVTQTPLGKVPTKFSRLRLEGDSSDTKSTSYKVPDDYFVSSGSKLADTEIRIRGADGNLCGDGAAGSIELHSESLFHGYWGKDGFQRQAMTPDGWYATGDYGFTLSADLFVIGRVKDIIIVSGVNIFPEDIEVLVNTVEGVYPGRAVAFGVDDRLQGTESLVVVAEMRGPFEHSAAEGLEQKIRQLISSVMGIVPRQVRVFPERWMVKSTAGKISRRETRIRFLQDSGNPVASR